MPNTPSNDAPTVTASLILETDQAHKSFILECEIAALGDDDLCRRTFNLLRLPTSDDMTILDLQWPPTGTQ